jgi:hypothetical protein
MIMKAKLTISAVKAITSVLFIFILLLVYFIISLKSSRFTLVNKKSWTSSRKHRELYTLMQYMYFPPQTSQLTNPIASNYQLQDGFQFRGATFHSIAFIHTQKVGGTYFERVLISNIVGKECQVNQFFINSQKNLKNCSLIDKNREPWLLARPTISWPCGTHASFSALRKCLPQWLDQRYGTKKRNIEYISFIREPLDRFVSEQS